ncbi:hypothetical protein K7432_015835 [Basidiobolus ranarum]|uniref:Uncharacterized protein n=1 Tax=Basidiobolus ranarum TaxID=34480 RepID=A0ABR2VMP8_9FUNG
MWVRATLVSPSIGKKSLESSSYFILQASDPTKHLASHSFYRVITKHFPHYKVAEGDEFDEILSNFQYLNETIVPLISGKKSSKSLAKWLKIWYDDNFSALTSHTNEHEHLPRGSITTDDESSILSHHSYTMEPETYETSRSYLVPDNIGINEDSNQSKGSGADSSYTSTPMLGRADENGIPYLNSTPVSSGDELGSKAKSLPPSALHHERIDSSEHSTSSLDDTDNHGENWWSSQGLGVLAHWFESPVANNGNRKSGQNSVGLLDIPIQFIALLTYPEVDPINNKPTYADLKEIGTVKSRRKVLCFLTLYTLIVRWCSFDLFLLVLFGVNCGVLFLMKNSGKINMQMAKRTVRQRANYMKQWAGGLFKKNGHNSSSSPPHHHTHSLPAQVNKGVSRCSTDISLDHHKHKRLFSKKTASQLDPHKLDEGKPKKKLFGRSSSKTSVASVPVQSSNKSESELNNLDRHGRLMAIDNSSF